GAIRDEVQSVPVGREAGVGVDGARVHHRTEIHRLRPLGVVEAIGLQTERNVLGISPTRRHAEKPYPEKHSLRRKHGSSFLHCGISRTLLTSISVTVPSGAIRRSLSASTRALPPLTRSTLPCARKPKASAPLPVTCRSLSVEVRFPVPWAKGLSWQRSMKFLNGEGTGL